MEGLSGSYKIRVTRSHIKQADTGFGSGKDCSHQNTGHRIDNEPLFVQPPAQISLLKEGYDEWM